MRAECLISLKSPVIGLSLVPVSEGQQEILQAKVSPIRYHLPGGSLQSARKQPRLVLGGPRTVLGILAAPDHITGLPSRMLPRLGPQPDQPPLGQHEWRSTGPDVEDRLN